MFINTDSSSFSSSKARKREDPEYDALQSEPSTPPSRPYKKSRVDIEDTLTDDSPVKKNQRTKKALKKLKK